MVHARLPSKMIARLINYCGRRLAGVVRAQKRESEYFELSSSHAPTGLRKCCDRE